MARLICITLPKVKCMERCKGCTNRKLAAIFFDLNATINFIEKPHS